jgi:hypothetical protein
MRRQMSAKGNRGQSGRAPRTIREDAIIHFTEPVTFGFFGSASTGRSVPEAGRSALGLERCLLFYRTVRSVDSRLYSVPVRGSPWCRGRCALSLFFQKASPVRNNLQYSGQSI